MVYRVARRCGGRRRARCDCVLSHFPRVSGEHVRVGNNRVAENQKVISTGPYAIVRHPMYASASLYLLGTPLALGSYWGFVPIAVMMPENEETSG
ncbi:MAG: methyltransferase [Terrimicrobiaceae bacterium]